MKAVYEARIRELQVQINEPGVPGALGALALGAVMFLYLGLSAIRGEVSGWLVLLPVPFIVVAVRKMLKAQKAQFRQVRLRRYYDRGLQRVNGDWSEAPDLGDEFADPEHVYTNDLNCFGEGSLFQLLCTVRTAIGRRRLAGYLSEPPAIAETLLRQEAVAELRELTGLRETVAVLGEYEFLESRPQTFEDWLDSEAFESPRWLPVVSAAVSISFFVLLIVGWAGLLTWRQTGTLVMVGVAFHVAIGAFNRDFLNPMIAALRPLSPEAQVLREGLELLEGQVFECSKLRGLVEQARGSAAAIARLQRPLAVLAERDKDWFYGPSRLFLAGTQCCILIEDWRREHGEHLRAWLAAWAEFEALIAVATYSREHPEHVFPEFLSEAGLAAVEMGHPLLEPCVVNDVTLNCDTPFYVVSGSNMSGKSTLLRSIGLNAVLAFAGAPVRAREFRISGFSIVASLSVGDSLAHGRSKFKAEVERLRQAIESNAEGRPVLFLVDEIFSGTNSRDRRVAAEAVVRTLVKKGGMGALSTHDLALAEIAEAATGLGGVNVHMGSRDGSDPMDFDYRLKLGVTTEANALAIARMAGVPV